MAASFKPERQITNSPENHCLDNNDNFSPDQRFLCYDTRETIGAGIDNSQSIEKVEIETGQETVLYKPKESITGEKTAPGVGAVSYSPVEDKVAFIHGPLVEEVPLRGYYGKPNRNGAEVPGDGSGTLSYLDRRDIDTSRDTLPGAHRGGTHRHEYSRDGRRIGFTYDDFLLQQYDRTIGYMEKSPKAPEGASHYFALLVAVPPKETAKPGEIEKAYGDSWVDAAGTMRAFIGKVREESGAYQESLFVVDIPASVDITTADPGSATRYPAPPQGLIIRRLTHDWAGGIVRGAPDGRRIAYYGHAADGSTQIFIIDADGSDTHADQAKRPVQVTRLELGLNPAMRWHPSGNYILCVANGGAVTATCIRPGRQFGITRMLTPSDGVERADLVISQDGKLAAFTKPTPMKDAAGKPMTTYNGKDFQQIYVMEIDL